MSVSAHLSEEAIQLFRHQWRRREGRVGEGGYEQMECPLHWLMPELLRLAQELGDSPTLHEMRPLVRRRVEDIDSVNRPGLHADDVAVVFERYIDTLVDVVAQVRDSARARGQWVSNHADATPIMCG